MTACQKRRRLLQGGLATGLLGVALGSGLLRPRAALAAWPKPAFGAHTIPEALAALGSQEPSRATSEEIRISGSGIVEETHSVRIQIITTLPAVDLIAILVPDNPFPLAASFELAPGVAARITTRIRMPHSGDVIALVRSDGRYYHARQAIAANPGETAG